MNVSVSIAAAVSSTATMTRVNTCQKIGRRSHHEPGLDAAIAYIRRTGSPRP